MTVQILLTRDLFALIDDDDAALVKQSRWWVLQGSRHGEILYAYRMVRRIDGGRRAQLMHQLLTGWPRTDHINGDGLDNRRANLRAASAVENGWNTRKRAVASSRYKGVFWKNQVRRWVAQIYVSTPDGTGKKKIHLGCFTDEATAALTYDAAARAAFGRFAALNFPLPGERSALV